MCGFLKNVHENKWKTWAKRYNYVDFFLKQPFKQSAISRLKRLSLRYLTLNVFRSLAKGQTSFEGQEAPARYGLWNRSRIIEWTSSYEKHLASHFPIKIEINIYN